MEPKNNQLVLVPTDFTEVAEYAVNHACGIAKLLKYKVILFHVINKETKAQLKKEKKSVETVYQKLQDIVNNIKGKYGIEAEYMAKEGSIFSSIGELAGEIGANFLVMGTHGKVGVQKFVGSYAWKVVTSSKAPTIVVQKKAYDKGYHKIVFNVDHTMESKHKIQWATYIAKVFNSTIHLTIHKEDDEFIKAKIDANLSQIKKYLTKNDVNFVEANLSPGSLARSIEKYAKSIEADLIMIMTDPDALTFILSPWAEPLMFNQSKIPVMCVNPIESYIKSYIKPY